MGREVPGRWDCEGLYGRMNGGGFLAGFGRVEGFVTG